MSHVASYNSVTGNLTGTEILAAIPTGSNKRFGTLTLTGATPVVVSNTLVSAATGVFLTVKTVGGTPAHFWVSARSAGASFSVTGTSGDTSILQYLLVEPV